VVSTTPRKGELFVDLEPQILEIIIQFNTWMSKESVKKCFKIEPEVSGTVSFVTRKEYRNGREYTVIEKDKIKFVPGRRLLPNTKYTVTLDAMAVDLYGTKLTPYTFSFITRPE
ncbi:MAG: Ig-like domain-containing protein, partial [Candidatus Latescibacteria bacterium]|nr:Ig-like domain-containing protein [Candidatus Latescibacterota bacterium]